MKINKTIHYIWLGGKEEPEMLLKCKESWKKYCPDYEIKRWDESNLDLNKYQFAKDAYDAKKWAFASDVFRFDVLFEEGGIYLDTDVELIKPIDEFLDYDFFTGFEDATFLNPGLIMGCKKGSKIVSEILDIYKSTKFEMDKINDLTVCKITSKHLKENYGIVLNNQTQIKNNLAIFSTEYFCPIDYRTKKRTFTKNTHSIHHYAASWVVKPPLIKRIYWKIKDAILGKKNAN